MYNVEAKILGIQTVEEIKQKLDNAIERNKELENSNKTDKLVNILNVIPSELIRAVVKFLMFLDK